jgi:hypothetical protein
MPAATSEKNIVFFAQLYLLFVIVTKYYTKYKNVPVQCNMSAVDPELLTSPGFRDPSLPRLSGSSSGKNPSGSTTVAKVTRKFISFAKM